MTLPRAALLRIAAAYWLVRAAWAVRRQPLPALAHAFLTGPASRADSPSEARAIDAAVRDAARVLRPRPSCLTLSLAAGALLARRQLAGRLLIAAQTGDGLAAAHAWIEHSGQAIAAPPAPDRFTPLCRIDIGTHPVAIQQ